MTRVLWWWVVASSCVVIASFAALREAQACGPTPCVPAKLTPAGGTIPANVPGVFWRPLIDAHHPDDRPDPARISLTRAADPATLLPFTATPTGSSSFLLVPDEPLTVGETYLATDATICEAYGPPGASTRFVVGPPAPLPTTLGTLAVSDLVVGKMDVPMQFTPCGVEVTAARQTVELTLAPEAVPWRGVLQLEVSVDDRPWTSSRYEDRTAYTQDWIYHVCATDDASADPGVASGSHTVRMNGKIAGTTMQIFSSTATIDLNCSGPSGGGPDGGSGAGGGCNAGGSGSSAWLGLALGALLIHRRRVSWRRT